MILLFSIAKKLYMSPIKMINTLYDTGFEGMSGDWWRGGKLSTNTHGDEGVDAVGVYPGVGFLVIFLGLLNGYGLVYAFGVCCCFWLAWCWCGFWSGGC